MICGLLLEQLPLCRALFRSLYEIPADKNIKKLDKFAEDSDDWEDEVESDVSLSNLDIGFGKSHPSMTVKLSTSMQCPCTLYRMPSQVRIG